MLLAPLVALRRPRAHRRPRFTVDLLAATITATGLLVVTGPSSASAATIATTVAATDGRVFRLPADACYRSFGTSRSADFRPPGRRARRASR